MPEYYVDLPVPPSINHLYQPAPRRSRKGYYTGKELTPAVRAYRGIVLYTVLAQGKPKIPEDAQLAVTLRLFLAREQDLDNSFKVLLDCLALGLGFDDKNVVEQHGYKRWDPGNPRAEVVLSW